jgi:SAM-dependent methyltransferase
VEVNSVQRSDLTPPYARYLVRLFRPFPNWDFFFIKPLRQRAVRELQLKAGDRVLDAGCGMGGTFPFLREAVGPEGEVVGVEISPAMALNAHGRIEANHWRNVKVVVGDARTIRLSGVLDGLVMFAAPDVYASDEAVANLCAYLKDDARVALFGAKLSQRGVGVALNVIFRLLMKLSFSSTPRLNYEPWHALKNRLADLQVQEYFFGCMFLAWGRLEKHESGRSNGASDVALQSATEGGGRHRMC